MCGFHDFILPPVPACEQCTLCEDAYTFAPASICVRERLITPLVCTCEYCCAGKLTGLDKQLSKSLDVEVQNDTSTAELATSPVGTLSEPSRYASCEKSRKMHAVPECGAGTCSFTWLVCSRKTLVYLILTLNQCFPDYDFSQLRARHFQKEENPTSVEPIIDSHLLQVSKVRNR